MPLPSSLEEINKLLSTTASPVFKSFAEVMFARPPFVPFIAVTFPDLTIISAPAPDKSDLLLFNSTTWKPPPSAANLLTVS